MEAVVSQAGRVAQPASQPLPLRIGGFGGVAGLRAYLRAEAISHVIDATHPFAAQMSRNAHAACQAEGLPLVALTRAPWVAQDGDVWQHVPDMAGAAQALGGAAQRVFLAVGRMHLADFATQPQHHYLLRLVDPPKGAMPLPKTDCVIARGPFSIEGDLALLKRHKIQCVVSKNAGGTGAYAKIEAARRLGLPVIMIDRPTLPARRELTSAAEVMAWVAHAGTDLGV